MKSEKWIWLVGGGLLQIPAILEAHKMGLQVIVSDYNSHAPGARLADDSALVSTHDIFGTARAARMFARDHNLVGVFTQGHSVEYTVATVAETLGLPGLRPDLAWRISDKLELRKILERAGVTQPRFEYCRESADVLGVVAEIGFPLVVKSVDNSGSRGLTIFRQAATEAALLAAFQKAQNCNVRSEYVLFERYLRGVCSWNIPEQSVETLWAGGKMRWLNWVDRPFRAHERYAIEIGHMNPSAGNPAKTHTLAERVGNALGFTDGILKLDVMQVFDEPYALEATARLSGGFDAQYTSPLAHGVNYIRGAMRMALGEPIDEEDWTKQRSDHAVALADFPAPGKVLAIEGETRARKFCDYLFVNVRVGDVIPQYEHCAQRPVFAIAAGENREAAIDRAASALFELKIHTTGEV